MKDLTQGSVRGHIIAMAAPVAVAMLVQTLYFLVDLYFVSRQGSDTVAGVSAGGNAMMLVMALTQMLSVGTVSLISHATGAKDRPRAQQVFNQAMGLGVLCMLAALGLGAVGIAPYMQALGAGEGIAEAGRAYLWAYLPGLALQFPMAVMASAMRGTGVAKPGMVVQMLTVAVAVNIVLAPVLIAGWGTGHPLGAMGAGLASSLAIGVGVVAMAVYFKRLESYLSVDMRAWWPQAAVCKPLLRVGLPAGGEFLLMFIYISGIYWLIRRFGPAAQAGFGIGMRVMQSTFLPAMAISFALPAVAGQNFGARRADRVRETFKQGLILECSVMLLLMAICHLAPQAMIGAFTSDPAAATVGAEFLTIISMNFLAMGVVFACSGLFQAMGNTWPAMASTATRLLSFMLPAYFLVQQPGLALRQLWFLSVATVVLQATVSALLVRWQLRERLRGFETAPMVSAVSAAA
ncbi:MATE family efflux transporter [Ideonella sp.]|uniref:MATE family efflux transporter n=1 Tax=Ideonella sp. TaxID=1929293 RepID=UPI0035B23E91